MKYRLKQYQQLKKLYILKALGRRYIERAQEPSLAQDDQKEDLHSLRQKILHCRFCERSKIQEPIFGILNTAARVVFVTPTPILDTKNQFLPNRSARMLQDILTNVFGFDAREYGILSLLKCADTPITKEEFLQCQLHFFAQLQKMPHAMVLCFGGKEALDFFDLLDQNFFGKLIKLRDQRFLITYSLLDLLKNPSLKRETMQHLSLLKEAL